MSQKHSTHERNLANLRKLQTDHSSALYAESECVRTLLDNATKSELQYHQELKDMKKQISSLHESLSSLSRNVNVLEDQKQLQTEKVKMSLTSKSGSKTGQSVLRSQSQMTQLFSSIRIS